LTSLTGGWITMSTDCSEKVILKSGALRAIAPSADCPPAGRFFRLSIMACSVVMAFITIWLSALKMARSQ
jgi:hypothetical protein